MSTSSRGTGRANATQAPYGPAEARNRRHGAMIREDYLRLMTEAAGSEYGIALRIGDPHKAIQARRKFYRLREKMRAESASKYDLLSFLVVPDGDLHIVRRNTLPRYKDDDGLQAEARPLAYAELPLRIGARRARLRLPASLNISDHF